MEFEFDPAKRLRNLEKHGLDFRDALLIFEGAHLGLPARTVAGETRGLAVGLLEGRLVTVVFTSRGDRVRIISMRRARHDERRRYRALYGG